MKNAFCSQVSFSFLPPKYIRRIRYLGVEFEQENPRSRSYFSGFHFPRRRVPESRKESRESRICKTPANQPTNRPAVRPSGEFTGDVELSALEAGSARKMAGKWNGGGGRVGTGRKIVRGASERIEKVARPRRRQPPTFPLASGSSLCHSSVSIHTFPPGGVATQLAMPD